MTQTVVFTKTAKEGKQGTNARGPWWLRVFETAGGTKFQTFDVEIGDQIVASFGTPVEVTYEVEDRNWMDDDGKPRVSQNNVIKSIKRVIDAEGCPVEAVPDEIKLSIGAQAYTASPETVTEPERQLRIMRQSGLDRAISTVAAGVVKNVNSVDELFEISDHYIDYFTNGR